MSDRQSFFDFDLSELQEFFAGLGQKPFRARQMMNRVFKQGIVDLDEMTELSQPLRESISERLDLAPPALVQTQRSKDGTVKLLLEMSDGERVETVLIPDEGRLTQCVSTQAGCAMGCAFCRTATMGLTRHLTAGEIVGQVVAGHLYGGFTGRVSNIVFMGMGEPLHNFDNTLKAFETLAADWGYTISRRRLTISTCGLVEALKKLPSNALPSLAISLNATTDEVRDRIMPVNRAHPIGELVETLKSLDLKSGARYTIEYVLLGGINDTEADARRLARLLAGIRCKINLIPYNPHEGSEFRAPEPEAVSLFQGYLLDKHFVTVVRKSRGVDILAACGQLKAQNDKDADGV